MKCYANTVKLCLLPTLQGFRSGWLSLHSTAAWQCQGHQNPCKLSVWAWLCPSSSEQVLIAGSGNLAQGAHDWAFKHSRPTFWIIDSLVCLRILWYFSKAVSNIAISHNNVCVSMKSVHASSALACSLYHPRSIPEVMQSLLKSVENFLLTSVNSDFHWLQWDLDQSQEILMPPMRSVYMK